VTPRVRLFADRDYTAFVRIMRLAEQRDISVLGAREQDGRWDHSRYEQVRVVAVDEEDAPLGYGEIHHEPSRFDPRRYFLRLAVDPRLRRQGIGAVIWTQLRAELDERSARIVCLGALPHQGPLPLGPTTAQRVASSSCAAASPRSFARTSRS